MTKTKEWAESLGIDTQDILAPVEGYVEPYKRTAGEVAVRTIILHGLVAAGDGINRNPIIEWFKDQDLWDHVSPREQTFLFSPRLVRSDIDGALWLQEAQWTLLWAIQKVESLSLPTKTCDSFRIVDKIMPMYGEETAPFISSAELRPASELRAEDERIYALYSHAQQANQEDKLPEDLVYGVLFQRNYAFRWLSSEDNWDDVII